MNQSNGIDKRERTFFAVRDAVFSDAIKAVSRFVIMSLKDAERRDVHDCQH